MTSARLYRIASVLLLLFTIGHTAGFWQTDPAWGIDAMLTTARTVHFDIMGAQRTFWDLFVAAGYTVGVLYLFAAVIAWQLSGLPVAVRSRLRSVTWGFALAFGAIAAISARFLFVVPIVLSTAITLCLAAAAWVSASESAP